MGSTLFMLVGCGMTQIQWLWLAIHCQYSILRVFILLTLPLAGQWLDTSQPGKWQGHLYCSHFILCTAKLNIEKREESVLLIWDMTVLWNVEWSSECVMEMPLFPPGREHWTGAWRWRWSPVAGAGWWPGWAWDARVRGGLARISAQPSWCSLLQLHHCTSLITGCRLTWWWTHLQTLPETPAMNTVSHGPKCGQILDWVILIKQGPATSQDHHYCKVPFVIRWRLHKKSISLCIVTWVLGDTNIMYWLDVFWWQAIFRTLCLYNTQLHTMLKI